MNLVNELQVSAERDDVLTVLRKTKRLASKLARQDIADWLHAEQNGYTKDIKVPSYRMVRSTLAMNTNGPVPAGFGYFQNGIKDLPGIGMNPVIPIIDPINTILSWIDALNSGNAMHYPLDPPENRDLRQFVHPMFRDQVTFMLRLNDSQIKGIPEGIKDKVLDWACALEEAGVKGEGQTFKDEEIRIGHNITFNISNSNIDQLNNMGSNIKKAQ